MVLQNLLQFDSLPYFFVLLGYPLNEACQVLLLLLQVCFSLCSFSRYVPHQIFRRANDKSCAIIINVSHLFHSF